MKVDRETYGKLCCFDHVDGVSSTVFRFITYEWWQAATKVSTEISYKLVDVQPGKPFVPLWREIQGTLSVVVALVDQHVIVINEQWFNDTAREL